jgi:hypothetical protein
LLAADPFPQVLESVHSLSTLRMGLALITGIYHESWLLEIEAIAAA